MNTTVKITGATIILIIIFAFVVGKSAEAKIKPLAVKGYEGWYKTTFSNLDPTSKDDVSKWREAFDKVAKNAGFKDYDDWYAKRDDYPTPKFKADFQNFVTNNALWVANHTPPAKVFKLWQGQSWYSDDWAKMELGLNNPLKWYLFKLYLILANV